VNRSAPCAPLELSAQEPGTEAWLLDPERNRLPLLVVA